MKLKFSKESLGDIVRTSSNLVVDAYSKAYDTVPLLTNYFSTAIGVVGGDFIAKQTTNNPHYTLRDLAFTASAAVVYSYLEPKMIEWSSKGLEKINSFFDYLREGSLAYDLTNSALLTLYYFPVNMAYWNFLLLKNDQPLNLENNELGIATLLVSTIPYLVVDYFAIKYLSKPSTKKWLRPFYSAVGLAWNLLFAGGNYLTKELN